MEGDQIHPGSTEEKMRQQKRKHIDKLYARGLRPFYDWTEEEFMGDAKSFMDY